MPAPQPGPRSTGRTRTDLDVLIRGSVTDDDADYILAMLRGVASTDRAAPCRATVVFPRSRACPPGQPLTVQITTDLVGRAVTLQATAGGLREAIDLLGEQLRDRLPSRGQPPR